MLIIGSALLGIFIFFALVLATIIFGAAARESEKDALMRRDAERLEGRSGDVTTSTPDPIHDRYVHA